MRRIRLVLPNGTAVTASPDEHRDLFDAVRGGGGGALGIVTELTFDLYPVDEVYAGNLVYPASDAATVTAGYARWVTDLPDDITTGLTFMNFPPSPGVPPPLRGRSKVIVRGCWAGPPAAGAALLDRWRAQFPPELDTWTTMPFADAATISNDPVEPLPVSATGAWLVRLDGRAGTILAEHTFASDGPPPVMLTELRHVGGAAVQRRAGESPSMAGRDHPYLLSSVALVDPTGAEGSPTVAQRALIAAISPYLAAETTHNFLSGEQRRDATASSTAAQHHEALRRLQQRLDPHDLLRYGVDHR